MSEYWVSKAKHWCKYCSQFVYDNKSQREKHDTSQKHKNSMKHFLRNLEKTQQIEAQNKAETNRLLSQIDTAALSSYTKDVGAGVALSHYSSLARHTPSMDTDVKRKKRSAYDNVPVVDKKGSSSKKKEVQPVKTKEEIEKEAYESGVKKAVQISEWTVSEPEVQPVKEHKIYDDDVEHADEDTFVIREKQAIFEVDNEDAEKSSKPVFKKRKNNKNSCSRVKE